jgi:hypothetical protein
MCPARDVHGFVEDGEDACFQWESEEYRAKHNYAGVWDGVGDDVVFYAWAL